MRSLVLAEPPIHHWIRDSPDAAVYQDFLSNIQEPAARAFAAGDDAGAMKVFMNGLAGTDRFGALAPEARAAVMQNALGMKALALSSDPYRDVPKAAVRRLRMPILIITGANTVTIHRLVNEELARLIAARAFGDDPGAGHGFGAGESGRVHAASPFSRSPFAIDIRYEPGCTLPVVIEGR